VRAYSNTVVNTTNYGIAISAGHDLSFFDNRIVSSGVTPDGERIAAQNVGAYIWNAAEVLDKKVRRSVFYNNTATNNVIGWVGPGGARNDWWFPDATRQANRAWGGALGVEAEAAERGRWLAVRKPSRA